MPRYKLIDSSPRLLPVDLSAQLIPGTFEQALDILVDRELDLSAFDAAYDNDTRGASAYAPAVLLKAILFGYSRGLVSSRSIERACRENVTFIALTRDAAPHFTTIAAFISQTGSQIAQLFAQVLYLCDRQGLIGREMFAIDGVKLPSNASKARSGTLEDFVREAARLESAVGKNLERHHHNDGQSVEPASATERKAERLIQEAADIRRWLHSNPQDRPGARGAIRQSNRTDIESAKMATSKGVIQGYCGVAAVDARHQIIVEAQAHGLEALIADNGMRARDERFADQHRHKLKPDPLYNKSAAEKKPAQFAVEDFRYDAQAQTCRCPNGKMLYRTGSPIRIKGYVGTKFRGALRDCVPCPLRHQCLRTPDTTRSRQVVFFRGKDPSLPESATDRMKRRVDSPWGRAHYGRRLAIVEPVFANLRYNKRLDRFTLRGRRKVDIQWKLYCLVHNIEKLAKHRIAA